MLYLLVPRVLVVLGLAISITSTSGQGTIRFDSTSYLYGTTYDELGMHFAVIVPTPGSGSPNHDYIGIDGPITTPSNIPYDTTPYMLFFRQNSPDDYVGFSLTGGSTFGLTSVQLADPSSPSTSVDTITFVGYKSGGTTVTETFNAGGNNATTFQGYTFDSDFASGLTSVSIDSTRWAMDNLVFSVPEPSGLVLLGIGGLMVPLRRRGNRTKSVGSTLCMDERGEENKHNG
jgi:hypothetical protein